MSLRRHPGNPIITRAAIPSIPPHLSDPTSVFNPSAVRGCDEIRLWQATNPTARDFRYETIGAAYTSSVLTEQPGSVYVGSVTPPAQGWTCFMVEMNYGNGEIYTTGCRVLPDVEPYDGTHCQP